MVPRPPPTNWLGDSPVNPWALAEGRAPRDVAAGQPYEVVIDRASADHRRPARRRPDRRADARAGRRDRSSGSPRSVAPTASVRPRTPRSPTMRSPTLVGRPGEVSSIRIAADDGVSQDELRDDGRRGVAGRRRSAHRRRTDRRDDGRHRGRVPRDVQDDPAGVRRDRPRGRLVQHPQHVLDPDRPTQPGVGAAPCARCVAPAGAVVGGRSRRS